MESTIAVEIGRVWGSPDGGEWDTSVVDIPGDTPQDEIAKVALEKGMEELRANATAVDALVHMFVYHINEIEFITPDA